VSDDDARELAACYEALAGQLFGYALLVTRQEGPLAEDVVQEAFQAAAVRWAKVRDLSDERRLAWLRVVVRNKVFDVYRRRQTARDKESELPLPPHAGTHDQAMARLADAELWSAVRTLPHRQYLVAVMRFRDHMTVSAIASELKVSTGTVSNELRKIHGVIRQVANRYIGADDAE
jgi:RNA polymerase sigma-70 factor (ECF subfamily)